MDLNLLKVFCALYTKHNASEAGKSLGLSQPAVSHALQRLRETLGDPLFLRASHGLTPTPRAQELGPLITKLMFDLENQLGPKTFDPSKDSAEFRIKSTDYFEQAVLPSFISVLRQDAPLVKVIGQSTQGILPKEDLEKGLIDIAVAGFFGSLPNGLYQQKLFDDKLVGLCRNRHPLLKNPSLIEFLKYEHGIISPEGKLSGTIDKVLGLKNKQRNVVLSFSSFMPAGWILQDSDLLMAMPARLAQQLTKVLPLNTFEIPLELPPIQIVQVWHESVHLSPRHQWMRKKIYDVCQFKSKK